MIIRNGERLGSVLREAEPKPAPTSEVADDEKPIERMNKDELIDLAVELGAGTRDELEVFTKAEIRQQIDDMGEADSGD